MTWGDNLAALETARMAGQLVGEAEAQARHCKGVAEKWKAHAEQMKADLEKVWEMYMNKVGAEAGQAAIKDGLTSELEKLDPLNKMLNSGYRSKLYDAGYEKAIADFEKRRQD